MWAAGALEPGAFRSSATSEEHCPGLPGFIPLPPADPKFVAARDDSAEY